MNSQLCVLEGHTVREAKEVKDYVQLYFDNGAIHNINGDFTVLGVHAKSIADLQGRKLLGVEEVFKTPEYAELNFDDGIQLHIDLSNPDPEAMELAIPGQPIVIWS